MTRMTAQEVRRLFGSLNRPDYRKNVRHRALLRKALELFRPEELQAVFGQPTRLTVVMGTPRTVDEIGQIKSQYLRNGRLVTLETDPPASEARNHLHQYLNAYDAYFMKLGDDYRIRNPGGDHVRIGLYSHSLGFGPYESRCPRRCLLHHTFDFGRRASRCFHVSNLLASNLQHPLASRFQHASSPALVPGSSRLDPIDIADDTSDDEIEDISDDETEAVRQPRKRKFLGIVDISDDEEDVENPRRRLRFLGVVDLTN
ncbi:hypothetical protein B0H12DRAFT_1242756 [Mycena haematopus]|nr:hypothetical protein B0H12DRAFT_1242756 [Mycena haematopus]